jgi:PTS system sorbose-specific IIA component
MNIILIGHGRTGSAMKSATEMIFGEMPHFHTAEFLPGEGYESLVEKLEQIVHDNGMRAEETLVVTDLFSGSPYNASATLALKGEVSDVIAGMSLPMCLTLAQYAEAEDPAEAVAQITELAPAFTRILSAELRSQEEEGDF